MSSHAQTPQEPSQATFRGDAAAGRIVLLAAVATLCVALAVLAGWAFDLPLLKSGVPGGSTMKVNTAVGLLAAGVVLLMVRGERVAGARQRWLEVLRGVLAGSVGALGAVNVVQYLAGVDLGIDQWLLADRSGGVFPGRMSVVTAACLLLFGVAHVPPPGTARLAITLLLTTGLLLATLSSMGYLYQARLLADPLPSTAISVHAAIALVVLFAGALLAQSEGGWLANLFRVDALGHVARLTLSFVVAIPALLGWIGLQGLELDLYGARGLMAWFATVTIATLGILTLWTTQRAARVEAELAAREAVHALVLRHALDAFVMMDAGGRIVDWNLQAERTFGWRREEVLGELLEAYIIPEPLRPAHRDGMARYLETREGPLLGSRFEITALRRDGREIPVELMIVPLHLGGGIIRFSGFVRDVSQQRETEEQLRQAQKMEAIGHLTGGVAHDFNNFLTVIIGDIEMEMLDRPLPSDRLERALSAAQRGATLVSQLLSYARRQTLTPRSIDINGMVAGMEDILRGALGEMVRVELRLAADAWLAHADPAQAEAAIMNLAVNARDAMPDGGTLTIETRNVELTQEDAPELDADGGSFVMLSVTDTGIGMPGHVVARALDPFFTTKEPGSGSGLGLSMVYGFARQSRGVLKIHSEPAAGTSVHLYLPRWLAGTGPEGLSGARASGPTLSGSLP